MHRRPRLLQLGAIVGGDAANEVRVNANSIIGDDGKCRRVLHQI